MKLGMHIRSSPRFQLFFLIFPPFLVGVTIMNTFSTIHLRHFSLQVIVTLKTNIMARLFHWLSVLGPHRSE